MAGQESGFETTLGVAFTAAGAVSAGLAALAAPELASAEPAHGDVQATLPGEGSAAPAKPAPLKSAHGAEVSGVVVTGVRQLLGDKIPLSVKDTPQSVNLVSQHLLQVQAVDRLSDALKNVPGITLNAGEGAARGDTVNIRGFSAFNDFFLDGVRDAAVYVRDSFDLQSVEVLKGPSATLFGRGSTGGAINQVSKAPTLSPFANLDVELGTNREYRETLDINRPISDTAAFRLNLMNEDSSVAGREFVQNRRWGVAPSLSLGIGQPTTATFAYMHLESDDRPDVGVPYANGAPYEASRGADYGLKSDNVKSQADVGTLHLAHDFGGGLTLENTFRAAAYSFNNQLAEANFGSVASGGTGAPTAGLPLSGFKIGRDAPSSSGQQTNFADQLDLTDRFETGFIRHVLVAGVDISRQSNILDSYKNPFNSSNNWSGLVPETPLTDPNANGALPREPVTKVQTTIADAEAIYVTDTMSLGDHFDVIAGARLDRFAANYRQLTVAGGALLHLNHTDIVPSPRVALIYKPTRDVSLYASYGTSFDPSAEALTLTTKTSNLGPVKAKSYEVGAKAQVLGGLLLTAAAFHTEVNNAQTNDPENPVLTTLDGDVRVQGLEFGASGYITPKLEITAGYTYLDGVTSGNTTATVGGQSVNFTYRNEGVPNLAPNAFNLWAEYDITSAWEAGLGVNYLDGRVANIVTPSSPIAHTPAYTVWNAMTSYRIGPRLKLQLNAINLFNTVYYDSAYYTTLSENHVIPGAGRTFKLSAKFSF